MTSSAFIGVLVFLSIINLILFIYCIWQGVVIYLHRQNNNNDKNKSLRTKIKNGSNKNTANRLKWLSRGISVISLIISCFSTLSVTLYDTSHYSQRTCEWTLRCVSMLYVFSKLWLYLFLIVRGKLVQNTNTKSNKSLSSMLAPSTSSLHRVISMIYNSKLSKTKLAERIISVLTIIGVPLFMILTGILSQGKIVMNDPFREVFCAFNVPSQLAITMLVVNTCLSISFICLFSAALYNAQESVKIFRQGAALTSASSSIYHRLMIKHIIFTCISVVLTIVCMTMLAFGDTFPILRALTLPFGMFDVGINVIIVHGMTNNNNNNNSANNDNRKIHDSNDNIAKPLRAPVPARAKEVKEPVGIVLDKIPSTPKLNTIRPLLQTHDNSPMQQSRSRKIGWIHQTHNPSINLSDTMVEGIVLS